MLRGSEALRDVDVSHGKGYNPLEVLGIVWQCEKAEALLDLVFMDDFDTFSGLRLNTIPASQ